MKITIITPSYNQGDFIGDAIESVAEQDHRDVEHIVVDGQSTDGTRDVLEQYKTCSHLKVISEPDHGQSHALNKGLRLATGDIIGWLNADDYYHPGCFSRVESRFRERPDIDIVYGDYLWVDDSGQVIQKRREIAFDPFVFEYLHVCHIPSTATFFRQSIVADGHFIDEDYRYAMDFEFFLRLLKAGYQFAHVPGYLASFRWHDDSKSTKAAKEQRREHQRALYAHNQSLRNASDVVRVLAVGVLRMAARGKRYGVKAVSGHYRDQWQ